jgi:SAM-dependent methyltransferase
MTRPRRATRAAATGGERVAGLSEPGPPPGAEATEQWRRALAAEGYAHRCRDAAELRRARRLGATWRGILRRLRLPPGARVYEFGCGGGLQAVRLALHGFEVVGVDASAEVLERAHLYRAEVEARAGRALSLRLEHADLFTWDLPGDGALCFEFGVAEHFLDRAARLELRRRMRGALAPGGHAVSVVPCGRHPLRAHQRATGVGGYTVPEIDYDAASLAGELREAGFEDVRVQPLNAGAWLAWHPDRRVRTLTPGPVRLALRALGAAPGLPLGVRERLATSLLAYGRRSRS